MTIVMLVVATFVMALWLLLLMQVSKEDWMMAAYNQVLHNFEAVEKLKVKASVSVEKLSSYQGTSQKIMKHLIQTDYTKAIAKLQKASAQLQKGNLKKVNIFLLPGYALLRKIPSLQSNGLQKKIFQLNFELYGKKHAGKKTTELVASMFSYGLLGLAVALAVGAIAFTTQTAKNGAMVTACGIGMVIVLVYALYAEVDEQVKKRHSAIERQVPNVLSKLALLVSAGMVLERAWKETAFSQNLELYLQMQQTSHELDNLVPPEIAYSDFIQRCNTKETSKLAGAILQNSSKGNAEVGVLLKTTANEAWQQRSHQAKRDAEAANGKLMIPTMLLFLAILVMIMVPVLSNLNTV